MSSEHTLSSEEVTTEQTESLVSVKNETLALKGNIQLDVDGFGIYTDKITNKREIVRRYTWTDSLENVVVQVISYGATITKIKVPDRHDVGEDIVLGYDTLEEYFDKRNPYFGATVGRVCNRIANGEFTINGEQFRVSKNWNNKHTLHGGYVAFDKFNWSSHVDGSKVIMSLVSPDQSEGFPGNVVATASFELLPNRKFKILYNATTTHATPINFTNHSYFNLGGHASSYVELYKHILTLNADRLTETDEDSIPTGKLKNVGGTLYDFRIARDLGAMMARVEGNGYDDNFCVTKGTEQQLTFVSRVLHPKSGRTLEVYSDQPGVQLYTSNFMPDPLAVVSIKQYQ